MSHFSVSVLIVLLTENEEGRIVPWDDDNATFGAANMDKAVIAVAKSDVNIVCFLF